MNTSIQHITQQHSSIRKNIFISSFCIFLLVGVLPTIAFAQEPIKADTLIKKLDSLKSKTDSTGKQYNNINPDAYNENTKLNGRSYFLLLGSNIKQEFTKPFHMKRRDWGQLGKFAIAATALGFADEPIQKNALHLRNQSSALRQTGNFISKFGLQYEIYTLAAFETYGLLFKSTKVKTTTLLATQAVVTGLLVESVLKTLTGRTRPNYYGDNAEAEPTFKGPFGNLSKSADGKRSNSSFPSGHTTAAFAAATVFAVEYKNKPLIPIVAYTMASLVGVSRITENKHWATDVFTGAVLGYLTGRQVSFNYHRFAKIKNDAAKAAGKNTVSFNLDYQFHQMMPGLVWKFG
ncbi:MAG: superfamily protein [Ferruginibacter sp.]|nr:superfamily protein [Ferruginibacter sp.]